MPKSKKKTAKKPKANLDEEKVSPKEQIKNENKQLRNILLVIGIFVAVFLLVIFLNYRISNFEHQGVDYKIVQEGNLLFYNTFFKVYQKGQHTSDYNFYIRNDPRELTEEVPFEGDYLLLKNMVIDSKSEFNCDGDGIISLANFVNVHKFFGSNVIKDSNATCQNSEAYNYILIEEGNETKIEETGIGCYKISVNDCEILEGTERFIIETFSVANENLK